MNINVNKLNGNCSSLFRRGPVTKNSCFKANLSGGKNSEDKKSADGFGAILSPQTAQKENQSRETNRIMMKFRSGKKLTYAELEHLWQAAPDAYKKIRQIQSDRERLEAQLKAAKSSEDADKIYICAMDSVTSSSESAEDKELRMNQYRDAYYESRKNSGEKDSDQREKPDSAKKI